MKTLYFVLISMLFAVGHIAQAQTTNLDLFTCDSITGSISFPANTPQYSAPSVNIFDGQTQITSWPTTPAGGVSLYYFTFTYPIPGDKKDGADHVISVKYLGNDLGGSPGSPQTLHCDHSANGYLYYAPANHLIDPLADTSQQSWSPANGSVTLGTSGLTSATSAGGSLISAAASTTGSEYEVRTTLSLKTLNGPGGTYIHYLRASANALSGTSGTYDSVELTPYFVNGGCSATLAVNEVTANGYTSLGTTQVSCRDGTVFRSVTIAGSVAVIVNGNIFLFSNATLTSGQPGIGAHDTPADGSGISGVQFGPKDSLVPGTISFATLKSAVFPNSVSLRWQGVTDDWNGIGIGTYVVFRNNVFLGYAPTPQYADSTVSPDTHYEYEVYALDWHFNAGPLSVFPVVTPPAGAIDPRRVGVRPTGAYWGGAGEQLDVLSGNLNYTLPLVKAQARGGWGANFGLSYNSQMWRQDIANLWVLGGDVGYGFGWQLMAGSLTPYWFGYNQLDHYVFTDSSGAEYRLDVNTNGVWSSTEGIYVYYDSNVNRVYFPNGSFWVMGALSGGTEYDAGTMYPTIMEDSNGNQILIRYNQGAGTNWTNSSARIDQIEDVRAWPNGGGFSYRFSYVQLNNGGPIPHLTGITNQMQTGETYTMHYSNGVQTLYSPQAAPFQHTNVGSTMLLQSAEMTGLGMSYGFAYDASGTGELTQVTLPYGGHLRWHYRDFTYNNSRTLREVDTRYLCKDIGGCSGGAGDTVYGMYYNNDVDGGLTVHSGLILTDPIVGAKLWGFISTGPAWQLGLVGYFAQIPAIGSTSPLEADYISWAQQPTSGNPYISSKEQRLDQGTSYQVSSTTSQTLDSYGNVTQATQTNYNTLGGSRTYTNAYLGGANYAARYIFNRLTSTMVTSGGTQVTLVTNYYDGNGAGSSGCIGTGGPQSWQHQPALHEYDFAYDSVGARGLVTATITPSGWTCLGHDGTGTVTATNDSMGQSSSSTPSSAANYSAPGLITLNNDAGSNTSVAYNSWFAPVVTTGPNGTQSTVNYDLYARPSNSTSVYGAVTNYLYNYGPPQTPPSGAPTVTAGPPYTQTAVTNGHWTRTKLDGLGRAITTETGTGDAINSTVDTEYDSCACSPMGKVKRVSIPYGGSVAKAWASTYSYDGMGRTLTVTAADGASATTYLYHGNQTGVTDAAGKWKWFTRDAWGNLLLVLEPDPANQPSGQLATGYGYDVVNHLTAVNMPRPTGTQYRQFNYDLTTMRLMSAVNPENGTVSYAYNTDGTLASKTDNMTPHQVTRFTYDPTWKRVSKIEFCLNPTQTNCANRTFTYGTTGTQWGRLQQVNWDGATFVGADGYNRSATYSQIYSYMGSGLVTLKRLQSVKTTSTAFGPVTTTTNFDLNYTYDWEARMVTMRYPGAVNPTDPNDSSGRTYSYTFDAMGRPYSLRDDQQTPFTWVTSATYNAAGQMAGMQSVAGTETRQYNAMLQTTRITAPGMDMQYSYTAGLNNGQIAQAIDGASGETITYQYDQLKRLSGASSYATNGATWSQNYQYDGFGNLTGKTPGGTIQQPAAPTMSMNVNASTNRLLWPGVAESTTYDANGNLIYNPSTGATYTYDVENRMTTATGYASGGVPVQETYIYGPDNKRMYRLKYDTVNHAPISEEIFVYGLGGEKVATYATDANGSTYTAGTKLYFAGKLIAAPQGASVDRLGSVRSGGTRYYPYGEEFGGTAVQEGQQFATYSRDGNTGLDYADQRYYNSMWGRFMTADPSASADSSDPGSLNLYAYSGGDPINFNDPEGLQKCGDIPIQGGTFDGQSVSQVQHGTSGVQLMAQLIYHEGGAIKDSDFANFAAYELDLIGIGTAILNQWDVDNGRLVVRDQAGNVTYPLGRPRHRSLKDIILLIAKSRAGSVFDVNGHMINTTKLDQILDTDIASGPFVWDNGNLINRDCEGVLASITIANGLYSGGLNDRYRPSGLILLNWNLASPDSTDTFPGSAGYVGVPKVRQGGETFWGLPGRPSIPKVGDPPRRSPL